MASIRRAVLAFGLFTGVSGNPTAGKYSTYPVPPVQTSAQQAVMSRWRAAAKAASDEATPQVLAFFAAAEFRAAIQDCCPKAAAMTPEELLTRFRAEVRAAELAHAFPTSNGQSMMGDDFAIDLGLQYGFFLNGYQATLAAGSSSSAAGGRLAAAHLSAGPGPGNVGNLAEVGLFGCAPFAESSPTWDEAADRLVYVAQNFRQMDFGSVPNFGNAVAVFNSSYVKEMLVMAPLDTGLWEMTCNRTSVSNGSNPMPGFKINCSAWGDQKILGTFEDFDHLILLNWAVWNEDSTGSSNIYTQVRSTFERSPFAEAKYGQLPNVSSADMMKYWETNILGNARFPEGVRFLIGSFRELFGTADGKRLQALADHFGWPLVWALSSSHSWGPSTGTSSNPLHDRVLDPTVAAAAKLNATWPAQAKDNFAAMWQTVNTSASSADDRSTYWASFAAQQLGVAPATAACQEDLDACVGQDLDTSSCICRSPADSVTLVV